VRNIHKILVRETEIKSTNRKIILEWILWKGVGGCGVDESGS